MLGKDMNKSLVSCFLTHRVCHLLCHSQLTTRVLCNRLSSELDMNRNCFLHSSSTSPIHHGKQYSAAVKKGNVQLWVADF